MRRSSLSTDTKKVKRECGCSLDAQSRPGRGVSIPFMDRLRRRPEVTGYEAAVRRANGTWWELPADHGEEELYGLDPDKAYDRQREDQV